jgi:ribosomal protein S18 acetylase RimI-like enzyme
VIRPTTPQDAASILSLAAALALFEPQQLEQLSLLFAASTEANADPSPFWLVDDAGTAGICGASYCEPERMTEDTWNLQFIGIHPAHQRQGRGTALIQATEQSLRQRKARIMLVETAASMASNHTFYTSCGFEREATIRDFYAAGEDKVVFRKAFI